MTGFYKSQNKLLFAFEKDGRQCYYNPDSDTFEEVESIEQLEKVETGGLLIKYYWIEGWLIPKC